MSEEKVMNRWLAVVGAILIQLALGAIYAWSVFTPKLIDAGWTKAQTQYVFSAGLAFFAIVMVISGKMMPKVGPRKLAITGGVVLGLGYILGGLFGGTSPVLLVLFIGVIGGSGIGIAYVVPIAVGMRWFPDKKGLITGLAVAGFGFGAMFCFYSAAKGLSVADLSLITKLQPMLVALIAPVLLGSAERRMTMSHCLNYKRPMVRGCMKLPMLCLQGAIPLEANAERLHTLKTTPPII